MNTIIYIAGILLMLLVYFIYGQKSLKLKIKFFALVLLLVNACFINGDFLLVQYGLTLLLLLTLNNLADKELSGKNIKAKINLIVILWLLDFFFAALYLPQLHVVVVCWLIAQILSIICFFQYRIFTVDLAYILGIFVFNIPRLIEVLDIF